MRVSFNRSALAEALGLVTSVVPSRTPKPVLRCVRISASGKEVRICATDLEVGLEYLLSQVEVAREGELVVEAERLAAIVRESTDDVLVLEGRDTTCEVRGADSRFTIYGQDPKQYPMVRTLAAGEADLLIALEALQAGIQQTLFATAKESSRYAINGVLWEVKGKKLTLVATDGRRLARCRVELEKAAGKEVADRKTIVPSKTMALLEKLAPREKETVAFKMVENQVLIRYANVVLSSNLVEGNFPKYEDIIPTDYDKKLSLPTEAFLSGVRRAALLTSEDSKGVKIALGKEKLVLSGSSPEAGAAEISMPVEYKGEGLEMGFNPQFLTDVLRVIRTSEVEVELGQPDRPGVLKAGADFLYVLMPINLG
jgi:DNA polymerase-3 subunit beta